MVYTFKSLVQFQLVFYKKKTVLVAVSVLEKRLFFSVLVNNTAVLLYYKLN